MSRIQRRKFAMELYAGRPPEEAAIAAGYRMTPGNVRRMACSPDIKRYIADFFSEDRQNLEVEAIKALRERQIIAYADMANYLEPVLDAEGNSTGKVKLRDITKLSRQQTAAIRSVRTTRSGMEIVLHDKDSSLRAIEDRVWPNLRPEQAHQTNLTVNVNQTNQTVVYGPRERIAAKLEEISSREVGEFTDA